MKAILLGFLFFSLSSVLVHAMSMSGMVTNQITRAVSDGISKNLFDNMIIPQLKVKNSSGQIKKMTLTQNKRYFSLLLEDGTARIWDLDVGVQRPMIKLKNGSVDAIFADENQSLLYIASSEGIEGYDFLTANKLFSLPMQDGQIKDMVFSNDRSILILNHENQAISAWDKKTKKSMWKEDFDGQVIKKMQINSSNLHFAVLSRSESLFSESDHLEIRDISNGHTIHKLEHNEQKVVFFNFSKKDQLEVIYANGDFVTWNSDSGIPISNHNLGHEVLAADKHANGVIAYASGEDEVIVTNQLGLVKTRIFKKGVGGLPLALLGTGNKLMTAEADGKVTLWNTDNGVEILKLISTKQGWTVVDNTGRFDSSEQGMTNVSWEAAKTDIPLDSFSTNYYEPGLLATALNDEAFLNSNPSVVQDGITLPPELEIVLTAITTVGDDTELTIEVYGQGGGIKKVDLYHNAKFIPNRRAVVDNKIFKENNKHRRTLQMRLSPISGENTVKVVATNNMGIEGQSNEISFSGEGGAGNAILHVATIGINKYRDNKLDLDFSVADAESISNLFNDKELAKFTKINRKKLYDSAATKLSILSVLNELSTGAENDVLAIYFAGHGIAVNGEWYFLPHETVLQPDLNYYSSVGISASELSEIFIDSKIQHILFMVDACYSGASVDSFRRLQNSQRKFSRGMSKSVGITVVTATRKNQEAAELSQLGHGLFTYVLLKGIKGEADLWPKDKQITAHELAKFATKTIPAITQKFLGAAQEPTAFTMGRDFSLLNNKN